MQENILVDNKKSFYWTKTTEQRAERTLGGMKTITLFW